jgi:hypothetical protein
LSYDLLGRVTQHGIQDADAVEPLTLTMMPQGGRHRTLTVRR